MTEGEFQRCSPLPGSDGRRDVRCSAGRAKREDQVSPEFALKLDIPFPNARRLTLTLHFCANTRDSRVAPREPIR